jgi:putative membrane protein
MKKYLFTAIKGMAMGAADVIPGVSGGTIAFMTGIYAELISSLKSIDHKSIKWLFKGDIGRFWKEINGNFLVSVFTGVLISIFTLARLMQYLLINHPIPLWSFFLGLIAASAIFILRDVKEWKTGHITALLAGIAVAAWISLVSPTETTDAWWFIFVCGMVAICAMILPGISGSFILLLMGKYAFMMVAIKEFNIPVMLVFIAGAAIGLIAFSHFLSWLLKKYYEQTIALLAGFMIGSLVKVWPWKAESLVYEGIFHPVLPSHYKTITETNPQLMWALLFATIGIAIVFAIEIIAKSVRK